MGEETLTKGTLIYTGIGLVREDRRQEFATDWVQMARVSSLSDVRITSGGRKGMEAMETQEGVSRWRFCSVTRLCNNN